LEKQAGGENVMKIHKKIGLRVIIPVSVLFIFIIFSTILYLVFTNFYFKNTMEQAVKDNEYAAKVVMDYIEEEKNQLKAKAKVGAEDDVLVNGLVNNIYIDLNKKIGIDKVNVSKMNKIRYLKTANNINSRIFGSSSHLYLENLLEIFDDKGKKIASVGGLSANYGDGEEDDYINYVIDDKFKTKRDLSTIVKKNNMYFIKGMETVYLDKVYGVVVVSKPFDALYLKTLSKLVNRDVMILEEDNIFLTTIYKDKEMLKNVSVGEYVKTEADIITIKKTLNNKEYIISIIPIKNYKNEIIANAAIALNLDNMKKIEKESNKKFLVGMFLFLTFISITTSIILKNILNPLKKILFGIDKIKEGDYGYRIEGKFDKDLGRIAESIKDLSGAIEKRENEIKAKNEKLLELDRLKDEFLANTSHELRTPLNGIIGIADSLVNGAAGELNKNALLNLELIISSGKRLEKLVNDILDFSKLKNKDIELRWDNINIKKISESVIAIFSMLITSKNLIIKADISDDISLAYCDEDRIEQVLYNLVGNAVKFTEQGSITISAKEDGEYLEIQVKDTGIGIPESKFGDIFKSFEQVDGSISKNYGGTGLGLSITKKLIELHGGKIWVKSKLGEGSEFYFTIPKSTSRKEKIKEINEKDRNYNLTYNIFSKNNEIKDDKKEENEKQGKILIVDDEYTNIVVLENYLKLYSYKIEKAMNGREAIAIIEKSQKWEYNLVILDVMMPQMSGYEVCKKIREKYSIYELPVLMLTAKQRKEDIVEGFENGANDYLKKPVEREELFARTETLISLSIAVKELINKTKEYENEKQSREISEKLIKKLRNIEQLVSIIYTEENEKKAIGYIMDIALKSEEMYFSNALYYKYNKKHENLYLMDYRSIKEENTLEERILKEISMDEDNIITKTLKNKQFVLGYKTEDNFIKLGEFNIYPVIYNDYIHGVFVFEINKDMDIENSYVINETLKILVSNTAVYFENIRLKIKSLKQEKLLSITELSKAIVHELRTPLAGIKGFAAMGINKMKNIPNSGVDYEKVIDYMKKIIAEGERVDKMARDLIEYSVLDEKELKKSEINFKDLIEKVVLEIREELAINDIKLNLNLEEKEIKADFFMIEEMLKHLLKNSIEAVDMYKPQHYINVEFKDKHICIEDNGAGIPKEKIDKIYEPLVSTKIQGTGLGLAIVKKIIEKHGWNIEIKSEQNKYTKVLIEI